MVQWLRRLFFYLVGTRSIPAPSASCGRSFVVFSGESVGWCVHAGDALLRWLPRITDVSLRWTIRGKKWLVVIPWVEKTTIHQIFAFQVFHPTASPGTLRGLCYLHIFTNLFEEKQNSPV